MNAMPFGMYDFKALAAHLSGTRYGRGLYHRLMSDAEWALRQPIPACPPLGPVDTQRPPPHPFGQSTYSDDYLRSHEAFDELTPAFEGAVLVLCLAYRMEGEAAYLLRAEEWVDVYLNEWEAWGPRAHPYDQFAVRIMLGMALYGWLAGPAARLNPREKVRLWFERALSLWGGPDAFLTDMPGHLGNHSWFNMSMMGITALYLSEAKWVERFATRLSRLTEWAIGEDGDYLDKPRYIMYALRYASTFFFIYARSGGQISANWDKVRRALHFALDLEPHACWIAPLLRAASVTRDGALEAMAEQLAEPPGSRYFTLNDAAWACLFYDPSLAPAAPAPAPALRLYRATGYAVYGPVFGQNDAKIALYAGPHSGKSAFDQGALSVSYRGETLIGPPLTTNNSYITAHRMVAHYSSNLSDLVAHIDGMGQCAGIYPNEWPDARFTGHRIDPPLGRILHAKYSAGVFSASADLTRAYAAERYDYSFWGHPTQPPVELAQKNARRAERFTRSVEWTPEGILTVRDEITLAPDARHLIDIFFISNGEVDVTSKSTACARVGRAAYDLSVSVDQPFSLSADECFMSERGIRLTVHISPKSERVTCISRFLLRAHPNT